MDPWRDTTVTSTAPTAACCQRPFELARFSLLNTFLTNLSKALPLNRNNRSAGRLRGVKRPAAGRLFLCLLATVAALALGAPAWGEHRALIVGVGEYRDDSVSDLPGIDLDVEMMRDAAELLGFRPQYIRALLDEEATLAGIRRELQNLAAASYGADDRVLLYFSGHGTHVPDDNGDEPDKQDEALVLHDTRFVDGALRDFLRDDEFGELLDAISANNVLVLVDACHSGTATKSFRSINERGTPKYLKNPSAAYGGGSVGERSLVSERRTNHVLLSAAADSELAQATRHGSAFTLGISEAIKAARAGGKVTPAGLQKAAARHIAELEAAGDIGGGHTPQLAGSPQMLSRNLFFRGQSGPGPTRRKLEAMAAELASMPFTVPEPALRVGDKVVLTLELPRDGYLNVVNVNPNDEALVLFPNAFHRENKVSAGRFVLPADAMDFDLVAREPIGESVTVAFLSEQSVNLYRDASKGRDSSGNIVATLAPLSAKAGARMRSIVAEARGSRNHAGKVVVRVSR